MKKFTKSVLREEMKRRKVKVPTLSEVTGIPRDRIYAWYRDNTNPKKEDQDILEAWLNEVPFNKSEETSNTVNADEVLTRTEVSDLIMTNRMQAEAILNLSRNFNSGVSVLTPSSGRAERTGIAREDLPLSGKIKRGTKRKDI